MGTKLKPGDYDCHALAAPDEPLFTLLARDRDASVVVRIWAMLRMQQIDLGIRPESDRAQVREALACATDMAIWHREHRMKQAMDEIEFDDRGIPTTGEHRRREQNSTSGANDG